MADTVRELITQAALAALNAEESPALAVRKRIDALTSDECEAKRFVLAKAAEPAPTEGDMDSEDRAFSLDVWCVVATSETDGELAPDASSDAMEAWAEQKLVGNMFGGLAKDCQYAGTEWINMPGELDVMGSKMRFAITYSVKRGDPTQLT